MDGIEEKVSRFFAGFTATDEMIAWCRGNGIKGIRYDVRYCLVSKAAYKATGVKIDVSPIGPQAWGWRLRRSGVPMHALPDAAVGVAREFDHGNYPDLVRTFKWLKE